MILKNKKMMRLSIACLITVAALGVWMLAAGASGSKWTEYAETDWYVHYPNNDTYTIDSSVKLAGIAELVNSGEVDGFAGRILKIAANMDLSEHEWVPIGTEEHPFRGTLYTPVGETYTLSGLRIVGGLTYAGLVGNAVDATIGGFSIADTGSLYEIQAVSDSVYSGSAVGKLSGLGTLYDINSDMRMYVDGDGRTVYAGGIAGYAEGTVSNSNFDGRLEASGTDAAIGGIIGYGGPQGLKVKRVANSADLLVESAGGAGDAIAGGIVGQSGGELQMKEDGTPIINRGAVTVLSGQTSYAGGIVGRADQLVTFSMSTTNEGAVAIEAPNGSLSAAGGLIGAITSELGDHPVDIHFAGSGSIVNNGGTEVYTGGIAGLLNTTLIWEQDIASAVPVNAAGSANVHTGGLIGHAQYQVQWKASARNEGAVTVAPHSIGGGLNEAFTGGLIGFSGDRILLEGKGAGAYANSGAITVQGGTGLYTGGIAANRAFARTGGEANNVVSTGAIAVAGDSLLHTGGYVGTVPAEAADHAMSGLAFGSSIEVAATTSTAGETVATGGIIGYYEKPAGSSEELSGLSFSGRLDAQGGGEFTYTGGIAGYLDNAAVKGARVGASASDLAMIVSDGKLGGVAGYLKGELDGAAAAYVELTARTSGSYAGGIAALARGAIANAQVGDESSAAYDTVKLRADIAGSGEDSFTAGGIVGMNDGSLVILNSDAVRTALLSEGAHSGYTLGGIAGVLTGEAVAGQADEPLTAEHLAIEVNASDSLFGGAIGRNNAVELYLATSDATIGVSGDRVFAGGVIGMNEAATGIDTSKLESVRAVITASGAAAEVGGIAGRNTGRLANTVAAEGGIDLQGSVNKGGGVAGSNAGEIALSGAVNMALNANAAGAAIGGIAGVSEPPAFGGVNPAITNSYVHSSDALLATAAAENVRMGGLVGRATETTIQNPLVKAEDSDYVILTLRASGIRAGGIAGETEGGGIIGTGDTVHTNVQQLFVTSSAAASDAYVGGITGYNSKTAIDRVTARTVSFSLGGPGTVAGGIAGYFQGTDSAVIKDSYMDTLGIKALGSAASSVLGGAIGMSDSRQNDAGADPATAPSTLQNTRIIGNVANSNSPVVDNSAANAVIGGMVGENRSLVANNSVIDKILLLSRGAGSVVGGHTGINRDGGTLYYTYANVNLSIQGEGVTAGGLAGLNEGSVLSSYIDIDVTGQAKGTSAKAAALGGLVGINKGLIDKSYSVSNVSSTGDYMVTGGLVGEQLSGSIRYSYAGKKITVSGVGSYAGGFAGRIGAGEIRESYSAANVAATGGAQGGGFAGRYDNPSTELLYKVYYIKDDAAAINKDLPDFAEGSFRWLNVPARLSTLLDETLRDRDSFPALSGWDFSAVWRYGSPQAQYLYPELIRTANSGGGGGTPGVNASINWYTRNPDAVTFEIRSEAELAGLATLVNGTVLGLAREDFAGRTIRIMNPIHIQSEDWIAIGADEATPFEGAFDGGGKLIDGLSIVPGQALSGLFGVIGAQGSVENALLEPLAISGGGIVGTVAAVNHGTLSKVVVELPEGTTVRGQTVGGIVGRNTGTIAGASLLFRPGAVVEAAGLQPIGGALIGDNSVVINSESFGELILQGTVRSEAIGAVIGGYVGLQSNDMSDLDIAMDYTVSAEGAGSIAGGVIGRHTAGELADLTIVLQNGTVSAPASDAIAGGITGVSESGNTLRRLELTAAPSAAPLSGGGTLGGAVGVKLGQAEDRYDIERIRVNGLRLTTPEGAAASTVGGLFGRLEAAAAGDLYFEGHLSPRSQQTTLGGIVGEAQDSLLRKAEALPQIAYDGVSGASAIGGVAGVLSAADLDISFDLGSGMPYYAGLYDAKVHEAFIAANGIGNAADLALGGLVGELEASLYFGESNAALEANGFKSAAIGGLAGRSGGIIVSSVSRGGMNASQNTMNYIGGAVGQAEGGAIHYSYVSAGDGAGLTVSKPVTKLPTLPIVYAGGFIGKGDGVKLSYASSDLPVSVTSGNLEDAVYAGGFAGALGENAALPDGTIQWAYATGDVHVDAKTIAFAGGFAASLNRYEVNNAYASGEVDNAGFDTRTGGFAGAVERGAAVTDAYAAQAALKATGVNHATRAYIGGFAGYNDGKLARIYAHASDISLQASGASAYKGALVAYQYRNGSASDSHYAAGIAAIGHDAGTAANLVHEDKLNGLKLGEWQLRADASFLMADKEEPYRVATPYQLFTTVLLANSDTGLEFYSLFNRAATQAPAVNILLEADIDLTGMAWKPYTDFRGQFDGAGHAVRGLKVYADGGAQGFATVNYGRISRLLLENASVETGMAAEDAAGIAAGVNKPEGVIIDVQAAGSVIGGAAGGIVGVNHGEMAKLSFAGEISGATVGGIAGSNDGAIIRSSADAKLQGSVRAGGIAGSNAGDIDVSSASGTVSGAIAGGIAGENASDGTITNVLSYSDVAANDNAMAIAGGIAGTTSGRIASSFFSGTATAFGSQYALAGGIAGHATGGSISGVVNAGEAQAGTDGRIVRDRTFFGGIAGQKETAATVESALYNRQMLKTDTAYYDALGKRVAGGSIAGVRGMTSADLSSGTLPAELSAEAWQATAGYYPQLQAFGGSMRSGISAAALTFAEQDTVYSAIQTFSLTSASDIVWTAEGASLTPSGSAIAGTVTVEAGGVTVTAAAPSQPPRSITIRKAALPFGERALPPTFNKEEAMFEGSIAVELETAEAGGVIYYTLDGSEPIPGSKQTARYSESEPLLLKNTTLVRALVIAEDKEPSQSVSRKWTLKQSFPGGGIFVPPPVQPAPKMTIGERDIPLDGKEPVKTALGSLLTLTVPDDAIVYYTTDGSEPTKNSPRYTGAIPIAGDMTVKFMTSKDPTVYTVRYEVRPAEFQIKPNVAGIRYMPDRSGGMFRPGEAMTREELVAAVANLLDFENTPIGSTFPDVPKNKSDLAAKFASAGIVQGYPDGTFRGERGLTRAEFVVMMTRILGLRKEEDVEAAAFADMADHWSKDYVRMFVSAGYVNGYPDGTFRPDRLILRAEAVVLLNRIMHTATTADPTISFKDVPPNHWAYEAITAAARR